MICKGGKYSVPGSPRVPARRAGEDKDASKAAVGKEGRLVRERERLSGPAPWQRFGTDCPSSLPQTARLSPGKQGEGCLPCC